MRRRASVAPSRRACSAYTSRTPTFDPQKTQSRRTGGSARRRAEVPVGDTLEAVPRGEHGFLVERASDQLEPDRTPVAGEAARESERGEPGQVEGASEAAHRL